MPIHDMAWWAPSPEDVILFFEDPTQEISWTCVFVKRIKRCTCLNQCKERV